MKFKLANIFSKRKKSNSLSEKLNISYSQKDAKTRKLLIYNNSNHSIPSSKITFFTSCDHQAYIRQEGLSSKAHVMVDLTKIRWEEGMSREEIETAATNVEAAELDFGENTVSLAVNKSNREEYTY